MNHKIWLDTDIGSDIDDALALAFLLNRPDCELLGISTVTEVEGNARAKLASVLCRIAQRQIPIYPGARAALLVELRQQQAQQKGALDNWAHDEKFPDGPFAAIEAMRAAIRANPGEVTLFAIGPLTNLALLFAVDPEIPSLLKDLVLMCGAFTTLSWRNGPEWNALNDPHATAMVYAAPVEKHISIGLDVTLKVTMKQPEFEEKLRQSKYGASIIDMSQAWFRERDVVTFHDPLAAATLVAPDICDYQKGRIQVEHGSSLLGGFTQYQPREDGPHTVALGVDANKFFDLYFETLAD